MSCTPPDSAHARSPVTWIRSAHEDLALAEATIPGVGFGLYCFHAQQAAEKEIKAILTGRAVPFPYIHDLGRLLELGAITGVAVPADLADADMLTDYATLARYPGLSELGEQDRVDAVATARSVLEWAVAEVAVE